MAKEERLEARVTKEIKQAITDAACLKGLSISDFVVESAYSAAIATIEEMRILDLTQRDRQVFVSALLSEEIEISAKAQHDANWYKEIMAKSKNE